MDPIVPYLTFNGNAEEAMNFYKDVFGAEESSIMRYSEMPPNTEFPIPDEAKDLVMHAHIKTGDFSVMAADSVKPGTVGTNVALSLNFTEDAEQTDVFNKLSDGGKVTMPLQDTFWGARFGMCTDKYGINWMFNKENPQE